MVGCYEYRLIYDYGFSVTNTFEAVVLDFFTQSMFTRFFSKFQIATITKTRSNYDFTDIWVIGLLRNIAQTNVDQGTVFLGL